MNEWLSACRKVTFVNETENSQRATSQIGNHRHFHINATSSRNVVLSRLFSHLFRRPIVDYICERCFFLILCKCLCTSGVLLHSATCKSSLRRWLNYLRYVRLVHFVTIRSTFHAIVMCMDVHVCVCVLVNCFICRRLTLLWQHPKNANEPSDRVQSLWRGKSAPL